MNKRGGLAKANRTPPLRRPVPLSYANKEPLLRRDPRPKRATPLSQINLSLMAMEEAGRRTTSSFCASNSNNSSPSSSTSSSSSSPSRLSPHFTPPSPSPLFSPFSASSSVPFSWEKLPGIPKSSPGKPEAGDPALPLRPPPLKSKSDSFPAARKKRAAGCYEDPFAVALMECSKEEEEKWQQMVSPCPAPAPASKMSGRRGRWTVAGRLGFGLRSLDLYSSCKTSCPVADSAIRIRRPGRPLPPYALLSRRTG